MSETFKLVCHDCGEPSTQNLCGKCALQHSHDFNDAPEYPRSASVLEAEICALRAERELLMAVVRAAMKFCNERYEGDDPSEAEALNSLEKLLSSLPKDLHAEVDAALDGKDGAMCLHRREHIRMASLDHPQGAVCSDCGKAPRDLETGKDGEK